MMTLAELVSSLSTNPYFGAGFGLFGVGLGAAILRKAANVSKLVFQRNFLQTLEVPCHDKSFEWVSQWITRNALNAQHLEVRTEFEQSVSGKIETKFDFMPSEGIHWIYYARRVVKIERVRGQTADITNMGKPWETIKLTTWGWDKDSIFFPLLEEGKSWPMTVCARLFTKLCSLPKLEVMRYPTMRAKPSCTYLEDTNGSSSVNQEKDDFYHL